MPTLTITVAAAPAARIARAIGRTLSRGRDATLLEVTEFLREHLRNKVTQSEDEEAAIADKVARGTLEMT